MNTFIVVMTGRNVANLSPLFNDCRPGDQVLLVPTLAGNDQTVTAYRNWLTGRIPQAKCLELPALESWPDAVTRWCVLPEVQGALGLCAPTPGTVGPLEPGGDPGTSLVLIGNGGTKPLQDALRNGLNDLMNRHGRPQISTLYVDARPVRLTRVGSSSTLQVEKFSGFSYPTAQGPQQSWLDDVLAVAGGFRRHRGTLVWQAAHDPDAATTPGAGAQCAGAAQDFDGLCAAPLPPPPGPSTRWVSALRKAVAEAVAWQLCVETSLQHIVAELWCDVYVKANAEDVTVGDWDVLLLLRNGVLLHLDCRSWCPDAAVSQMHEALRGLVDTTAWCVPLPALPSSAQGKGPAMLGTHCHATYRDHPRWGRRVLPWVLGDQRVMVGQDWLDANDFGDALHQLLKPYVPLQQLGPDC